MLERLLHLEWLNGRDRKKNRRRFCLLPNLELKSHLNWIITNTEQTRAWSCTDRSKYYLIHQTVFSHKLSTLVIKPSPSVWQWWPQLTNSNAADSWDGHGVLTCEQFSDGFVLSASRADEKQPGRQELVMTGQELGDGPGGARGGPLLPLTHLAAFIDGVHQQEERLLGGLHTQEREEDTSEEQRKEEREMLSCVSFGGQAYGRRRLWYRWKMCRKLQ